jgi:hypothetical protein
MSLWEVMEQGELVSLTPGGIAARPAREHSTMRVFHGTSQEHAASIGRNGLRRGAHVTTQRTVAEWYAARAARRDGLSLSKALLVTVEIPRTALRHDPYSADRDDAFVLRRPVPAAALGLRNIRAHPEHEERAAASESGRALDILGLG